MTAKNIDIMVVIDHSEIFVHSDHSDQSEIFECTEDPTPPPITFSGSIVHAFSLPCSQPS